MMTGKEMSGRERVLATLRHQIPDRVPVYEVLIEAPHIRRILDLEAASSWTLPPKELVMLTKGLDLDAVMLPIAFWKPREMMDKKMALTELTPPSRERVVQSVERCQEVARIAHEEGLAVCGYNHGCFDVVYEGLGFNNFMMLLYDDFDYVDSVTQYLYEFHLEGVKLLAQTDVDFIQIGDDIAFKTGLFIRPDMFKKLWYEREKDIIRAAGATRQARGVPHTDGALDCVLPWLLEMGVDIVNPVEPYSNDIVALKKEYGGRVALRGNVDLGGVLVTGTPEQVYEETKQLVLAVKDGGNYVCSTSHSLTKAVPRRELRGASARGPRIRGIRIKILAQAGRTAQSS